MNMFERWVEVVSSRYIFFAGAPGRKRQDDYPWEALGKNSFSLFEAFKYNSIMFPFYRRFFSRDSALEEFRENSEKLWKTRCLFSDEISCIQFDESLLIRMLGHKRYIIAPEFCDELIRMKSFSSVLDKGIPEYANNIKLELIEGSLMGDNRDFKIYSTRTFIEDSNRYRQYFLKRKTLVVKPEIGDVVFDCGSCLGDTSILFATAVGSEGRVHAFDPIPLHSKILEKQIELNRGYEERIVNNCCGVSDVTRILDRQEIEDSLCVSPGGLGNRRVSMIKIDDYVKDSVVERLDFLKMDIEGAELSAIAGAADTIKKFRPKLAICVYHRGSDYWHIPELIHSIDDGYTFAFAHHSPLIWESMVYCFPNR
jgi:FkbM family methyltransferase